MSEATQQDTTEAAPVSGGEAEETSFEFGLNPEDEGTSTLATEVAEGTTPTEEPSAFDADKVDWRRVDPSTLPEQYRPLAKIARDMQSGVTKAVADLQTRQQEATAKEQQYLQLIEKLATPQNGQTDAYADIRANLAPEQQAAIDTVREVVKREAGDSLTQIQEKQNTLEQGLLTIAKFLQTQQTATVDDEAKTLRDTYGDDIDQYADGIKALRQIVNPKTGKGYTVTEAYENLSGAIVDKTINARKTDQEVRSEAAGDTLFPPSAESVEGQAPLSETAVDAALKKLGFD